MDHVPGKPRSLRDDAVDIVRTLRAAGHVAYLAGGCVRDALLGLEPKDYDVATDAPPARVQALFKKTQAVGAAFGVILVRLNRSVVEVATFRTDGRYEDGRRPSSVEFTDARHDAQRRDFTINGLFYDPIEERVIDYVGGEQDLRQRTLRAIGVPADRFNEDYLRLLRAVRFAARFGLTIDPATAAAIEAAAPQLPRISGERIADELRRMLIPPTRSAAFQWLWQLRLLDAIAADTSLTHRPLDASRSVLLHLSPTEPVSFALAWTAALIDHRWQGGGMKHDVLGTLTQAESARRLAHAKKVLKLSNDELDEMADLARQTHALLNTREPRVAMLKRFLARRSAGGSRGLLNALRAVGVAVERIDALNARLDALARTDFAPTPWVSGDDLVRAGYSPGPAFKAVLDAVYDAQLEATVATASDAMTLARQLLANNRTASGH
ncbi:MAG: CCA tRNA nucleotidyltransferase [Tepidisphaeraceae bacterium]